jgi:hypothetical protein
MSRRLREGKNSIHVNRYKRVTKKKTINNLTYPTPPPPTLPHPTNNTDQHTNLAHIHPNIRRFLTAVDKRIHIVRVTRVAVAIIAVIPIITRRAVKRLTFIPLPINRHPPRHIRKRTAIPHALVAEIVPNAAVRVHHVLGVVDGVHGGSARHLDDHAAVIVVRGFGHGVLLAGADFVHGGRGVVVAAGLHGLEDEDGEGAFIVDVGVDGDLLGREGGAVLGVVGWGGGGEGGEEAGGGCGG